MNKNSNFFLFLLVIDVFFTIILCCASYYFHENYTLRCITLFLFIALLLIILKINFLFFLLIPAVNLWLFRADIVIIFYRARW